MSVSESTDDVTTPAQSRVPFSRPWRGSEYAGDYETTFRFVRSQRYHGYPARLLEVVRHVYGDDYSDTEYQRIRRFINRTAYLRAETEQGFTQVEPTPEAFGLDSLESAESISQKRKTESGSGDTFDKLGETVSDTTASGSSRTDYPKDRINRLREKVVRLDGYGGHTDHRQSVFREFAQYRENTADKFTLLQRRITDEYLLLPYQTRFNTGQRAESSLSRFKTALRIASEDFRVASVLTLPVDPKGFESHAEATERITEKANSLKSYLRYRTGGFESVSVFDFQRNGLPHYHIVLFGVRVVEDEHNCMGNATVSEAEVREYWDENAGMGEQIAVQPAWLSRNDDWVLHEDGDGTVSLSYYLGKRIRELLQVAELDESELWELVESGDLDLWRHALFWVTQKRYVSCSESLRESDDGDDLPYAPAWEYVGTMGFEQVPSYVLEKATVVRTASRTSATG